MLKKLLPALLLIVLAVLFMYLFFRSDSIQVGMPKSEVVDIIDPDKILGELEFVSDTIITILPNSWNAIDPNQKYIIIFTADTVNSFGAFNR